MTYVYILYLNNHNLYTGVTEDLRRRYSEHQNGQVRSTNKKMPVLIHYEAYMLHADAIRREKYLKTTEGKQFLKRQIRDILREKGIME